MMWSNKLLPLDYSLHSLSMPWQLLMKVQIIAVLKNEGLELSYNSKHSCAALIRAATQAHHRVVIEALDCAASTASSTMEYLSVSVASETE